MNVNIGGLRLGAPSSAERDRFLSSAREAAPTYDHVGSTLDSPRSSVRHVREQHRDVGRGRDAFEAAKDALRSWVPHTGIGAKVEPAGQRVELGATVLVVLRLGPVHVLAPNRVVAVIDESRRFGFAYGTLPGHPERGEESFIIEQLDDGAVRATIRVQAVPATLPARACAPIVRWLQGAALRRYLGAIADHVTAGAAASRPREGPA